MHPERQRLPLPDFDYAQPGSYFVTICAEGRLCLLGEVAEGLVALSCAGEIVRVIWQSLPRRYAGVQIDEFVIMPNHIHGIIGLQTNNEPLPAIVGAFKSLSAKAVNAANNAPGRHLLQRSYHEHVIRDERARDRIREYINHNPLKWQMDRENPADWERVRRPGRAEPGPYNNQ